MCDVGAETVCLNGYAARVRHGVLQGPVVSPSPLRA